MQAARPLRPPQARLKVGTLDASERCPRTGALTHPLPLAIRAGWLGARRRRPMMTYRRHSVPRFAANAGKSRHADLLNVLPDVMLRSRCNDPVFKTGRRLTVGTGITEEDLCHWGIVRSKNCLNLSIVAAHSDRASKGTWRIWSRTRFSLMPVAVISIQRHRNTPIPCCPRPIAGADTEVLFNIGNSSGFLQRSAASRPWVRRRRCRARHSIRALRVMPQTYSIGFNNADLLICRTQPLRR